MQKLKVNAASAVESEEGKEETEEKHGSYESESDSEEEDEEGKKKKQKVGFRDRRVSFWFIWKSDLFGFM